MRGTFKAAHPLTAKGKKSAQVIPFHLHFKQTETVQVLQGRMGVMHTYDSQEIMLTPSDPPFHIKPYTPHILYPDSTSDIDTIFTVRVQPSDVPHPMDDLFFANLLRYISDVVEGKEKLDLFQFMLLNSVTDSAIVMLPSWWFLGPLRWWIPYQVQELMAWIARLQGKTPFMKKYANNKLD